MLDTEFGHIDMTTNIKIDDEMFTILHFNDVYNIEPNSTSEPVGGAARFCTAIKSFHTLQPLILFSGDVFSPSMCMCIFLFIIIYIYIVFK